MKITLSKSQWEQIGKEANWEPTDPSEFSDGDPGEIYDADSEESLLYGEDEVDDHHAYKSGYSDGLYDRSESDNPYRTDTDNGLKMFLEWQEGFGDAKSKKPAKFKLDAGMIPFKLSKNSNINIKKAQNLEIVKTPEKFTERELTRAIRDYIIAEEGAIKQYETVVDASDNEKVKEVLQDISNEEKVHVGELQKLLSILLKDEQGFLDDGAKEVE